MRKLVIDRRKWLRGEGVTTSRLLRRSDQKQCCVGFYLEACGVSREVLLGNGAAHSPSVSEVLPEEAGWLVINAYGVKNGTEAAKQLYTKNDDILINEEEREAAIYELFLKYDVEIEFIR